MRQQSERNQRSARRYIANNIANLNASVASEDDFQDCEEEDSTPFPNLDGLDDISEVGGEPGPSSSATMPNALPFDETDTEDDKEAWKKSISLRFDR